jgi:glycosyltransferase involved in cell wall biosynthesis
LNKDWSRRNHHLFSPDRTAHRRAPRVCHLTSVHRADDTRIFFRECVTLARAGYDVFLVAPDAVTARVSGVEVIGVRGCRGSRLRRMVVTTSAVYRQAARLRADIYHFHDPELLPLAFLLWRRGKPVIFDVHEAIYEQIKMKDWLPLKSGVATIYKLIDRLSARLLPLVLAEDSYSLTYSRFTKEFVVVRNMPDVAFFDPFLVLDRGECDNGIFYVGDVTPERGIEVVLQALVHLSDRGVAPMFHCVGPADPRFIQKLTASPAFRRISDRVRFYGRLSLGEAYTIAKNCRGAVALLQPVPNYVSSYPTKIFEYMAVALPVITSNFELYRNVVEKEGAGVCVDPTNPTVVADALEALLCDPAASRAMGQNGRRAVERVFNWDAEARKLLNFYDRLLEGPSSPYYA